MPTPAHSTAMLHTGHHPGTHPNHPAAGVSAGSIIDLQAQLYKTQEHARQHKDGSGPERGRARPGSKVDSLLVRKNAGVEERDKADKASLRVGHWEADRCVA